jgi:hypothetical protein
MLKFFTTAMVLTSFGLLAGNTAQAAGCGSCATSAPACATSASACSQCPSAMAPATDAPAAAHSMGDMTKAPAKSSGANRSFSYAPSAGFSQPRAMGRGGFQSNRSAGSKVLGNYGN